MRKSNRKQAVINPVTELRRLLGTEDKPIHTSKLATLVDVPADTLRSVETGRRSFNAELQKRLRRRGLEWEPKDGRWFFTYGHSESLSLPLLEEFRRLGRGDDFFRGVDLEAAKRRVAALLQRVDELAYHSLLLDLNDSLETLLETYAVDGARKEFQTTELRFEFIKTPSGGRTLVKNISGLVPPDHLFEEDEHCESSSSVQPAA
jgi:hypothetical protein